MNHHCTNLLQETVFLAFEHIWKMLLAASLSGLEITYVFKVKLFDASMEMEGIASCK